MRLPTPAAKYERRMRDRHSDLVDRKFFGGGLNDAEAAELAAINGALDALEEPLYRSIKEKLRKLEWELREAQR